MDTKGRLNEKCVRGWDNKVLPNQDPRGSIFLFYFFQLPIGDELWFTFKTDSSCKLISVRPIWPTSVSLEIDELEHKSEILSL